MKKFREYLQEALTFLEEMIKCKKCGKSYDGEKHKECPACKKDGAESKDDDKDPKDAHKDPDTDDDDDKDDDKGKKESAFKSYFKRVTEGEDKEEKGDGPEYKKFFKKALEKFGVKEPDELKGGKKKEFFDYVDKNWKGDNEKD